MGGSLSKEIELAQELQRLCDNEGKELYTKSAKILRQFGLLYKAKSQDKNGYIDKMCLIQSAAFLNAAIVRKKLAGKQSTDKYEKDLKNLCCLVLRLANAEKQEADLIAVSKMVYLKIQAMRNFATLKLAELDVIPSDIDDEEKALLEKKRITFIRDLQDKITEKYTEIMHHVSEESIKIMGKPPSGYCVAGMGSLARREVTPFSDFEHCILLEEGVQKDEKKYEKILEYFRWYSVICQIIVVNLKETIVKSVAVRLLNDELFSGFNWFYDAHTTCGIKFDGMQLHASKFPLGRMRKTDRKSNTTELIKPVSEMATYLEQNVDLANGYHLADVLSSTCFVSGCSNILDQFQEKVRESLRMQKRFIKKQVTQQIKKNLKQFDVVNYVTNLGSSSHCDIKRVIYRTTTIFIPALGRLHFIDNASCFEIIDCLKARNIINENTSERLLNAVAFACETRLRVYLSCKGQDDLVGERNFRFDDRQTSQQLVKLVGEQSLVEYFAVASSLQTALEEDDLMNFKYEKCSIWDRLQIISYLDCRNEMIIEWNKFLKNGEIVTEEERIKFTAEVALIYKRNNEAEKALQLLSDINDKSICDVGLKLHVNQIKIECLLSTRKYAEAMKLARHVIASCQYFDVDLDLRYAYLNFASYYIGECQRHYGMYVNAVQSYRDALLCGKLVNFTPMDVDCYRGIGSSLLLLDRLPEALENAEKAVALCRDSDVAVLLECGCYSLLGACHFHNQDLHKALWCSLEELKLRLAFVPKEQHYDNQEIRDLIRAICHLTSTMILFYMYFTIVFFSRTDRVTWRRVPAGWALWFRGQKPKPKRYLTKYYP